MEVMAPYCKCVAFLFAGNRHTFSTSYMSNSVVCQLVEGNTE